VVCANGALQVKNKEAEIERRTLTYSQWEQTKKDKGGRRGWHPMTFNFAAATVETIRAIQVILLPPPILSFFLFFLSYCFTNFTSSTKCINSCFRFELIDCLID
jgi:hypothetical protein